MNEPAREVPTAAELAGIEAELPEEDRLRVRDYWDAVVAEELGAPEPAASPGDWSVLRSGERTRLRRYERRAGNAVLRLVTAESDGPSVPQDGEAA
ncbi:hypothetical protein [Saccharopolyspora sp. SCSIO 74807]|uniref:hypothetical protein n=1 Tax=Saccharopolyspora sp. SCSIO 74807 TaxID=3118084 RepID=UPI0030CE5633